MRKQTPEAWRAKRGLCEWPYTTMSPVGTPITNLWLERRKNAVVVVLLVLLVRDQVAMVNDKPDRAGFVHEGGRKFGAAVVFIVSIATNSVHCNPHAICKDATY